MSPPPRHETPLPFMLTFMNCLTRLKVSAKLLQKNTEQLMATKLLPVGLLFPPAAPLENSSFHNLLLNHLDKRRWILLKMLFRSPASHSTRLEDCAWRHTFPSLSLCPPSPRLLFPPTLPIILDVITHDNVTHKGERPLRLQTDPSLQRTRLSAYGGEKKKFLWWPADLFFQRADCFWGTKCTFKTLTNTPGDFTYCTFISANNQPPELRPLQTTNQVSVEQRLCLRRH